jgi:hypothetical protein
MPIKLDFSASVGFIHKEDSNSRMHLMKVRSSALTLSALSHF